MKTITGAILILTAEQAFTHSQSVPFPNQIFANEVLYPSSIFLAVLGFIFLIWGLIPERGSNKSETPET